MRRQNQRRGPGLRFGIFAVLVAGLALLAGSPSAQAQAAASLSIDISSPLAPTATWSTTPAATECRASWAGVVGPSGTATLPPITSSVTYTLDCDFAGDSLATITWTNPTQNTDGSPYTDPGETRLYWGNDGSVASLTAADCLAGSPQAARPADQTMHTATGLSPGSWQFVAFAVNSMGICSAASNVATKMISGSFTASDSVSIVLPEPITGLGVN